MRSFNESNVRFHCLVSMAKSYAIVRHYLLTTLACIDHLQSSSHDIPCIVSTCTHIPRVKNHIWNEVAAGHRVLGTLCEIIVIVHGRLTGCGTHKFTAMHTMSYTIILCKL